MYKTKVKLNSANWKPAGRDAKVYGNILKVIGNTPLVKLNRIPKDYGLDCEIYAKCEFMNPGGSIKDRIAYTMVKDAEHNHRTHKDTRFVEPTSGNTGIGIALTATVKGYKATIVTPDKNSDEKLSTLRLLGADIVQTPSSAKPGDPDHFMTVAENIVKHDPNSMCLNQFENPINPWTHMEQTGSEIVNALGHVDMAVLGAGTGGTVTGIANHLKRVCPECTIVGVDPIGSLLWGHELAPFYVEGIGDDFLPKVLDKYVVDKVVHTKDCDSFNMAREIIRKEGLLCGGTVTGIANHLKRVCPECTIVGVDPIGSLLWGHELAPFYVEGIGDDFLPKVLDKYVVDKVVHTKDCDSFNMAREIIRKEGLLCGGSGGAAMFAVVQAAKELKLGAGKKVVVVLPDGIRNYMSKFVCDQWMEAHLFKEIPLHPNIEWWNHPLDNLPVDTSVPHVKLDATCRDALAAMDIAHTVVIVVNGDGIFQGAISKNQLRHAATNPKKEENLNLDDHVQKHMIQNCFTVVENKGHPTVGLVSRTLDITPFVVKVEEIPNPNSQIIELFKPKGVITNEMVWNYILQHLP